MQTTWHVFYAIKTAFTHSKNVFVWSWSNGNGAEAFQ